MDILVVIIVAQLFCSVVNGELCEDVDSTACARIANLHPDMCNDSCIANVCKRHCGHCPLKCYRCTDISVVDKCNTTEVCPSTDHSCTVAKSYTDDFRLVYKLGCAQNSICQTQSDFACCTQDLCNHDLTGTSALGDDELSQVLKRATSGVCADTDDVACNLLYKANPNMCSEDCIATSLCPRLCGKCYECYECDHVSRTENCNTTRICDSGHVCYTMETLNLNFEHGFKVGCIHNQVCNRLATEASNIFGRRDSSLELTLNGGCCHGDLCNLHKQLSVLNPMTSTTMAPTTTKTTSTTTDPACHYNGHCPHGYRETGAKCYSIVYQKMSWYEAERKCEQMCGTLAVFSDHQVQMDFIRHTSILSFLRHDDFFVGGHDPSQTNNWEWVTNGQPIPNTLLDTHVVRGHYCATARYNHLVLGRASCSSSLHAVCQADYRP